MLQPAYYMLKKVINLMHLMHFIYAKLVCQIFCYLLKVKKKGPHVRSLKKILCRIKRGVDRSANSECRKLKRFFFSPLLSDRGTNISFEVAYFQCILCIHNMRFCYTLLEGMNELTET